MDNFLQTALGSEIELPLTNPTIIAYLSDARNFSVGKIDEIGGTVDILYQQKSYQLKQYSIPGTVFLLRMIESSDRKDENPDFIALSYLVEAALEI